MEPTRDEAAAFVQANAGWMLRLAVVLCRDHHQAEDLVQDAVLRALRHWARVRRADQPKAYLRRLLVNEFLRGASSRSREVVMPDVPINRNGGGVPADPHVRTEDQDQLTRLLGQLPARQAAALALRYLNDCEYPQVAAVLRCRESTARSLVHRGLVTLREQAQSTDVSPGGQQVNTERSSP